MCKNALLSCTIATVIPGKAASAEWDEPKKRRKGATAIFDRHTRENMIFLVFYALNVGGNGVLLNTPMRIQTKKRKAQARDKIP